ncbi:ComF family protein [Croceitalea rosinachiae]|uniref:Phosphoribosyltransferase family protein n=1 Tax=Croceitalea rosinachiae TaxID=3075596 RepID=A0ABU3AAH3_9FLAO|nr:phosphoribosyltransferase family protein [Croceitalea sp. F388]MDT0606542.1 phosphoribosyltransferase family protein [Croceitalea sp. F388]
MPPICFGCNAQLIRGEHVLCTVCRHDLPITDYNFTDENEIDRIFYGRVLIKKAAAFLFFSKTGIVKNLLHYLKYKNQEVIGDFLGNWYGELLAGQSRLDHIDLVIPVPLHHKKLKKRGYNQVTKFGRQLANHFNADFVTNLLIKTANTKTQTKKSRLNRWQANQNLYQITDTESFKGKRILLVDDVITTGATIEMCAVALHQIEGIELYVATMAMVPKVMN